MSEKKEKKKFLDLALLKRVFRYAAPYKKRFFLSLFLSVLLAVLAPIRPHLIQLTVNDFIASGDLNWVVWITVIQIGLLMVESGFRFYFTYITAWLGQHVVNRSEERRVGKECRSRW